MSEGNRQYGRVTEWETSTLDVGFCLRLFAEAQYGRGSIPKQVEIENMDARVRQKYPRAEFVGMKRTFVPCVGGRPRRVRWQLQWSVWEG